MTIMPCGIRCRKFKRVLNKHHHRFAQRVERLRLRFAPWQIRTIALRFRVSLPAARVIAEQLGISEREIV